MTLADRNVCRAAMRDNLAFDNFIGQRLEMLIPNYELDDLEAVGLAWEACKQAYTQGLKDAYACVVSSKEEKQLAREREDRTLVHLVRGFKREINPDYVSAQDIERVMDFIGLAYRQGFKEGKFPIGALAL